MKLIIFFLAFAPVLYEAFSDRFGETKGDKIVDAGLLVAYSALLAGGAWWLGYRPLPVIGLILGWRILTFDYITNLFLQEFSEGHKNINWFTFVGTTSFTDRIISKIHPVVRLAVRVVLFGLAVLWYINPTQ